MRWYSPGSEDSNEESLDTKDTLSTTETISVSNEDTSSASLIQQFMYIQMEFCEKSTLRYVLF